MKFASVLLFVFCSSYMYAQTGNTQNSGAKHPSENETDSVSNTHKRHSNSTFFKVGFATGVVSFNHKSSTLLFQSGPGIGADFMIATKAGKSFSVGVGGNFIQYRINKKLLDKSIENAFAEYDFKTIDTADKSGSMNKTTAYLYTSYGIYRPSFIVEFYAKLGYSFTQLQLSNIVYRRAFYSNYSEYFVLNRRNTYGGFVPSAGISAHKKVSRGIYLFLSGEYGYYFNSFNSMQVNRYTSTGDESIYDLNIPRATHIIQANIGLMFRPSKNSKRY